MSRSAGFDRMDVATSIVDDPKFRTLARVYAQRADYAIAVTAYVGLLALSWREGERLTLEEGWPMLLPYEKRTADAMRAVGLVDEEFRIPEPAWQSWFGSASERRRLGREKQHRADVRRGRTKAPSEPDSPTGSPDRHTDSPSGGQAGPPEGPTVDRPQSSGGPTYGTPRRLPRRSRNGAGLEPVANPLRALTATVPTEGPCRDCGGFLSDKEPCRVGAGWIEHAEHPQALTT
jgi:hypothetical protein